MSEPITVQALADKLDVTAITIAAQIPIIIDRTSVDHVMHGVSGDQFVLTGAAADEIRHQLGR